MNCPDCKAVFKSFTFSTGETITLCRECGHESGHEVLQQGSIRKRNYESDKWEHENPPDLLLLGRWDSDGREDSILPQWKVEKKEITPQDWRGWGACLSAQPLAITVKNRRYGTYHIPPEVIAVAERFRVRLKISVLCECEIPDTPGPADPVARYFIPSVAELKKLAELHRRNPRMNKLFLLRARLADWKKAARQFVARDDSPFKQKKKPNVRLLARRVKERMRRQEAKMAWILPNVSANRPKRDHVSAAHGAEEITHVCSEDCQCWLDWRPFINWRPMEQPSGGFVDRVEDWIIRFTDEENPNPPALSLILKRLLWTFRATYPGDPWKTKKLFFQTRVDAKLRRLQLRSWINGIPRPHRYAKAYECWDFKKKKDATGEFPILKANLDYTIVKREHPREKKVPGYKTHDSWRDIMAYFASQGKPISRRTAFNKIKEGFRIPEAKVVTKDSLHAADF